MTMIIILIVVLLIISTDRPKGHFK